MFTNRLFYLLIVITLVTVTACAPQATSTPFSPTAISVPAVTLTPIPPTLVPAPTLEAAPREFKGHKSAIWGLDISRDGNYLVTG